MSQHTQKPQNTPVPLGYVIIFYDICIHIRQTRQLDMEFSAKQIAEFLHGTVEGNENATVNTFSKIEEGTVGAISFLANQAYEHYIYDTASSIVLVNDSFKPAKPVAATLIRVQNAYEAVAKLLQLYDSMKQKKTGVSSLAYIDPTATVGKDCYIGPFVAIGPKAAVGDGCVLHPHVTIGEEASIGSNTEVYSNAVVYHGCKVGNNCILHAGCVIGADGFGFAPSEDGYNKIPQIGIVTIEDNVEIGANTCIDRSTMGSTIVKKGVKLDNLVQIAHNVVVGENTVMSSQVGIAGSTKVGRWCMFGGQVGVAGHISIADRTTCAAKSGVSGSVINEHTTLLGLPAIDARKFARCNAVFRNLPEISSDVQNLKREIAELKGSPNKK